MAGVTKDTQRRKTNPKTAADHAKKALITTEIAEEEPLLVLPLLLLFEVAVGVELDEGILESVEGPL